MERDRRPDLEGLLENTGWLRALAIDLAGDPDAADDLLQGVWLAALERPPRGGDERARRGWLARVLRNLWIGTWRTERRRSERERGAARREAVGDPTERLALQRSVIDALLQLPEMDREVVTLRYFKGLEPRLIARLLGQSDAAVRSRLSRALGRLRERLDLEHLDRRTWAVALLGTAPSQQAPGPALPIAAAAVLGVLLGGAAWLVLREPERRSADDEVASGGQGAPTPSRSSAAEIAESVTTDESSRVAVTASAAPVAAPEESSAPSRTAVQAGGRVVDEAHVPIPGAAVRLVSRKGRTAAPKPSPSARCGSDGRFELELHGELADLLMTRSEHDLAVTVAAESRVHRTFPLPPAFSARIELGDLVLEPGGAVEGRVVDESGFPLEGATVRVARTLDVQDERVRALIVSFAAFGAEAGIEVLATTAADGGFRLDGVPARPVTILAGAPRRFCACAPSVTPIAGGVLEIEDLVVRVPSPDERIAGRAERLDGTPVADAEVELADVDDIEDAALYVRVSTDDGGRFEFAVPSGSRFRLRAQERSHGGQQVVPRVEAGGPEVVVRFPPILEMLVRVRDESGEPVAEPKVHALDERSGFLRSSSSGVAPGELRVRAPDVPFSLRASAPGFGGATLGPFDPAAPPDELEFRLSRLPALRGRVTADGVGIANATIHGHLDGPGYRAAPYGLRPARVGPLRTQGVRSGADGRFELPLVAGEVFLHVHAGGFARAEVDLRERKDEEELEIRLSRGGTIEGRVSVAQGVEAFATVVAATAGDGHFEMARADREGRFRFEAAAPGTWQVYVVEPSGWSPGSLSLGVPPPAKQQSLRDVDVVAGRVSSVEIDQRSDVPCLLRGRRR